MPDICIETSVPAGRLLYNDLLIIWTSQSKLPGCYWTLFRISWFSVTS